jgi:hypothetical protein
MARTPLAAFFQHSPYGWTRTVTEAAVQSATGC